MPSTTRIEFYDHFPVEILSRMSSWVRILFVGKTEVLPSDLIETMAKAYEVKEFIIVYETKEDTATRKPLTDQLKEMLMDRGGQDGNKHN